MKLEDQVCTLEQSIRLKELGIYQNHPTFCFVSDCKEMVVIDTELVLADGYEWSDYPCYAGKRGQAAAFTVAELGIMLGEGHPSWQFEDPKTKDLLFIVTRIGPNDPLARHKYRDSELIPMNTFAVFDSYMATEAAARAELLIASITCGVPGFTIDEINERLKNA